MREKDKESKAGAQSGGVRLVGEEAAAKLDRSPRQAIGPDLEALKGCLRLRRSGSPSLADNRGPAYSC